MVASLGRAGTSGIMAVCDMTGSAERYGIVRAALTWAIQAFVAARRTDLVLVVEARSLNDCDASATLALSCLLRQHNVDRDSLIQFANYRGSPEHTAVWLSHFPNTYFEVSFSAMQFARDEQLPSLQGLQAMDRERMLLASGGPAIYTPAEGPPAPATPAHLGILALRIASHRGETMEFVLHYTQLNADRLYRLRLPPRM